MYSWYLNLRFIAYLLQYNLRRVLWRSPCDCRKLDVRPCRMHVCTVLLEMSSDGEDQRAARRWILLYGHPSERARRYASGLSRRARREELMDIAPGLVYSHFNEGTWMNKAHEPVLDVMVKYLRRIER